MKLFYVSVGAVSLVFIAVAVGCATSSSGASASSKTTPFGGKPHAIPGLIEAEHYDEGKPGEAYYDVEEKNQGVDYRGVTQVDIEQRPDASNGHGVGWTRTGEWLVYTVDVKKAGVYTIEFPVASNKDGGNFHIEMVGADVTGPIHVPDTGSWQKLTMIQVKTVRLKTGVQTLKMVMDSQGASGSIGDIDYMRFTEAK
jgi:chitinase